MNSVKPLIDLFEENELNVSRLYRIYSEKFSDYGPFWKRLSQEEIDHADKIHALRGQAGAAFVENNFTRGIVAYVISFVKEEIAKAELSDISDFDAVKTALRIEQSILEKKCFEFFQPTDKSLKEVMDSLNRETEKHFKILQQRFEKLERKARPKHCNIFSSSA